MSTRQSRVRGDLAQDAHASRPVVHRALEMRNAADDVHAHRQRLLQELDAVGASQHAVLRERDELQVEVRLDALLDVQQRFHGKQTRVAHVDVRADREQPLGHGPVAVTQRALDDRLLREERLQLSPQRDAFEERAALVHARQSVRQRRIHVEVRVDERRREQVAAGVDHFRRGGIDARRHIDDAPARDEHIHAGAAIGQRCVGDQQVGHDSLTSCRRSCLPRRRARAGCSRGR
jgi:hypothetical protein